MNFAKQVRAEKCEIWLRFRAEISHMRPIQGRKLKLFKVSIQGKLTLMSIKGTKIQITFQNEVPRKMHLTRGFIIESRVLRNLQLILGPKNMESLWKNMQAL